MGPLYSMGTFWLFKWQWNSSLNCFHLPWPFLFPAWNIHVQINDNGFAQLWVKAQHLLCTHMDPLHHLFNLSVIITLFSTGDFIKMMAFFPLLNEELCIGSKNWCSVFVPYPLKTLLFKTTEYICHLEMKLWKYLQCLICLFDFGFIRLCILSILYMLPHSTYIGRFF